MKINNLKLKSKCFCDENIKQLNIYSKYKYLILLCFEERRIYLPGGLGRDVLDHQSVVGAAELSIRNSSEHVE